MQGSHYRYKPKPENAFYASRLKAAMKDADMRQQQLAETLAAKGLLSKGSKSAVSNWVRGVNQPEDRLKPVIAAVLGKSMSYFTDPAFNSDYWADVARGLARLVDDVVTSGGKLVEEAERRSGDPRLFDRAERQMIEANQAALVTYLRRVAPAWEALDPEQRLQLIEGLLRGEEPPP